MVTGTWCRLKGLRGPDFSHQRDERKNIQTAFFSTLCNGDKIEYLWLKVS